MSSSRFIESVLKNEDMGVSRSGRIRKKSSKYMDFESPDEIDITRTSRKSNKHEVSSLATVRNKKNSSKEEFDEMSSPFNKHSDVNEQQNTNVGSLNFQTESNGGFTENDNVEDSSSNEDETEINENLESHTNTSYSIDANEGFQPILQEEAEQSQLVSFLDRPVKKKLVIKDGKILGNSKKIKQCKQKTKSVSAYMLWAKEIRQELLRGNPDLDFSQMSKKLGELWATVPVNEKYIWKRRAKRSVNLPSHISGSLNTSISSSNLSPSKQCVSPTNFQSSSPTLIRSQTKSSKNISTTNSQLQQQIQLQKSISLTSNVLNEHKYVILSGSNIEKRQLTTLELAAYIKLLGESLTNIGQRLQQHEGSVTGSSSVMYDSLLCVLIPLMGLIREIPQFSNYLEPTQLQKSLEKIAYIMPGV